MGKNLLIVESPAKAKTIEKYLGKDFVVKASYGHVRDLPKADDAIDVDNGFNPKYEVISEKKDVIKELKEIAKDVELIWLATDEDREGEAISWHLAEVLGLDIKTTKRIVYHEISKKAITDALENPRPIDLNLVNAQQARRVLDRLVGFKLSPVLWTKVRTGLSAGRVQSVAVRLIVEREREINAFSAVSTFKVTAEFDLEKGVVLKATLKKDLPDAKAVKKFLESCVGAEYKIAKLETKPGKKSPSAPFITSTLQQEASRKLSFSVAQTMRVAQTLYEAGHITYMRTDSTNLSDGAMKQAEEVITKTYGEEYHNARTFKTKAKGAQEAHEAIRPTDLSVEEVEMERNEKRLYDLIRKRTLASQMSDAKLEKTTATIEISTNDKFFVATGQVVVFDGFLKVYNEAKDEDAPEEEDSGMLPPLNEGQVLPLMRIDGTEKFSRPPSRYTEASLVKKLEEQGIGRPSTYAPTISTIQKRNYVVKEHREGKERVLQVLSLVKDKVEESEKTEITGAEKGKLFPTDLGMVVTDFLMEHFKDVLDYSFTRNVEEEFDEIARGEKEWNRMIESFYGDFSEVVKNTKENAERAGNDRVIGVDPKTGLEILARFGKYGPFVQLGPQDEEKKPKYASLRNDQRIDTLTLEEAIKLFELPRVLGEFEEQELRANIGRFGPYVHIGKYYVSIPKDEDVYSIGYDRAVELIKEKRERDANKNIADLGEDCKVLNGRYGPYVKMRGINIRIPKDVDPKSLTYEDCEKLWEENKDKPKRGRGRKKKS